MKKLSCFLLAALFVSSPALANQTLVQKSTLLGKQFLVQEQLGSAPSGNGVNESTLVQFLGKSFSLITADVGYTATAGQIQSKTNDLYINGIKVWTGTGTYNSTGSYSYTGSVAPTQVPIPIFSYSIGPVVLQVNAGVSFEGSMQAQLSSPLLAANLSSGLAAVATSSTLIDASINTSASASGFVEGTVRAFIIQGGIGGNVGLIDGNASVAASILVLDPTNPTLTYDGKLQVMNGNIYVFVDYLSFTGWHTLINKNVYSWNGKCWAMGTQSCTVAAN